MIHPERISYYQNNLLGLKRDEVHLCPPNPFWKKAYEQESTLLQETLKIPDLTLYHCGSTSIPNLEAKPIIDILGSVKDLSSLDNKQSLFEDLGYAYKGEYGIEGRRYCVLYNQEMTIGFIHLHFFKENSSEIKNHLLFKNYLSNNPEAKKEYENLKRHLIYDLKVIRSEYSPGKSSFINSILKIATPPLTSN